VSLDVSVRLRVVSVVLMCCLVCVCLCLMACASFIVCVRAVFESDMMMHGYCGGASSCAMISAMSSAVLLHVFVGVVCGDFCLLCLCVLLCCSFVWLC
jgi:hypothetical protein